MGRFTRNVSLLRRVYLCPIYDAFRGVFLWVVFMYVVTWARFKDYNIKRQRLFEFWEIARPTETSYVRFAQSNAHRVNPPKYLN